MSVYVDKYEFPYGRMKMSHMIADTLAELHAMADRLGLRRWFQDRASFPHYDVCLSKRAEAIQYGAILLERRDYVLKMREIRSGVPSSSRDERKESLRGGHNARRNRYGAVHNYDAG